MLEKMKRRKILHYSLLLMLLAPMFGLAKGMDFPEEKVITKNYQVSGSEKLNIENEFGQVVVNTWDKNEISVVITIKASSKSPTKSIEIINAVKFMETRAGGSIYLKTDLQNSLNTGKNSIHIDYQINMPSGNPLNLINKFGNVYMSSFKGPLQLSVSYGNIKAEKLTGADKRISVSFGAADIEEIENGNVESKYSRLTIEKMDKGEIKNSFGKTNLQNAGNLKITQKYGDIDIKKIHTISALIEFANISIGSIGKSAELSLKYSGNADMGTITSAVELLKIDANFSTVRMNFDETAGMNFDAHLKFGDLKLNNMRMKDYVKTSDEHQNTSDFKGKIGKGGEGTLMINSSYTTVYFQ